jgi:hypothetical protein
MATKKEDDDYYDHHVKAYLSGRWQIPTNKLLSPQVCSIQVVLNKNSMVL